MMNTNLTAACVHDGVDFLMYHSLEQLLTDMSESNVPDLGPETVDILYKPIDHHTAQLQHQPLPASHATSFDQDDPS